MAGKAAFFNSYTQKDQNGLYSYSSRPRAVETRSKYKESAPDQSHVQCGNMMSDPRVARGGNTSSKRSNQNTVSDSSETQKKEELRKRIAARKRAKDQFRLQSRTPEPVLGRQHIDVQTELYLEELSAIIQTTDTVCQTDMFLDKPATPLYVPAKTGKDVETQIEEGELFDFDREVQPMVEVLVGKTVEQALLEVMEEEELAYLRAQQRAYQECRNAELAEVQRLREQERRRREEKERRVTQQREALKKEKELAEKIAARAYTQQYLAELMPTVFTALKKDGYLHDPVQTDIETDFVPWLMGEVSSRMQKRYVARQLLDTIIHEVAEQRMENFEDLQIPPVQL